MLTLLQGVILYADKGYLSKGLTANLARQKVKLVTGIRKNMKPQIMSLWDRLMLRKRYIIETIFDQLKNISQIEHSRHRNPISFMVHLLAGLIAYTFQPKKPRITISRPEEQALVTDWCWLGKSFALLAVYLLLIGSHGYPSRH